MADHTKISWADATWNVITGCSVHSAGCTNCYAMRLAGTRLKHDPSRIGLTRRSKAGPVWTGEVRFNEKWLLQPLRWKRPRTIFVCAHADLFHEDVPDKWIDRVFAVMALCPQHTFQVLTKRSGRMHAYFSETAGWRARIAGLLNELKPSPLWNGSVYQGWQNLHGRPDGLPNVWLGVSVEDQRAADERIPDLLATPAAVRWISAEPLLGPLDLTRIMDASAEECFHNIKPEGNKLAGRDWTETRCSVNALTGHYWGEDKLDGIWEGWCGEENEPSPGFGSPGHYLPIDWVICGGESGPGSRPMHPDWARSLRDQCTGAGVPFHFKQWGDWGHALHLDGCEGISAALTSKGHWPHPKRYRVHGGSLDQRSFKSHPSDHLLLRVGKGNAGRLLDGVLHDAIPEPRP